MEESSARRGVIMVALAGVLWSLQGLVIRMVATAGPEQIVFWRSIGQGVMLFALLVVISRGRVVAAFRTAGVAGLIGGLCHMVASTCFVFAITHTTVANVVFMMASSPFFAAVFAWLLMREKVPARTLAAMALALAGIGVMTAEGGFTANLAGNVFAFLTTLGFAGIAVVARWGRGIGMLPATCWGSAATVVVAVFLTGGDIAVSGPDLGYALASGGVLTAGGATLFLLGARYIPAGVLAFLTLTEVVLAPLWVWGAFREMPSAYTLAGGAVVLTAILAEGGARLRRPRAAQLAGAASGRAAVSPVPAAMRPRWRALAFPLATVSAALALLALASVMMAR